MSWFSQNDFNEVEARYRAGLQDGLCFHLENAAQAEATVKEAMPLARKAWDEAGGDVAAISLLARVGAETWRRVFTDLGSELVDETPALMRGFALESQLARYLEMVRFEAIIAEADAQIARLWADCKEGDRERLGEISVFEMQKMRVIAEFYDKLLPIGYGYGDDEDDGAAPALCASGPVAPRRGPGEGRAWEEADALPRNP